jgi:D-arabinose 1-dehydrogenase-like Zn-dependent alcohol dehydrogenase
VPIDVKIEEYRLDDANEAVRNLKAARVKGSAVLRIA